MPHMVALHGEDDQTVREYRDGDDLRRIHWPASARTGELMVRQEDRPAKRRAVVILGLTPTAHAGSGRASSLEWWCSRWPPGHRATSPGMPSTSPPMPGPTPGPARRLPRGRARDPGSRHPAVTGEPACGAARRERADLAGRSGRLHGGPIDDVDGRSLAALRQPGSTGAAIVIDPASFDGHPRRGGGDDVASASASVAALHSNGWLATVVDAQTTASLAWGAVVGAQSVGTR